MYISAIFLLLALHYVYSVHIIWDNSVDFDDVTDLSRADEVRMPNWFFIFPGTKWCGAGNIAENENDFGTFKETDMCCKAHDNCPDVIEGHQTKYNLTNTAFYSRLSCECDEEFHRCLKDVDSRVSTQVGHLYFTGLNTKCYKYEYPIKSCKKYSYLPTRKCKVYELDETQPKQYQWFDVPNY